MSNTLLEDGKVVGSASVAVLLDYAPVFNQVITLMISVCTLIYVANRAWQSLPHHKKHKRRKGKK
jgi:hypothetical protein